MGKRVAPLQISTPSPTPIQVTKAMKVMSPTTSTLQQSMRPSIAPIFEMPMGTVTISTQKKGEVHHPQRMRVLMTTNLDTPDQNDQCLVI